MLIVVDRQQTNNQDCRSASKQTTHVAVVMQHAELAAGGRGSRSKGRLLRRSRRRGHAQPRDALRGCRGACSFRSGWQVERCRRHAELDNDGACLRADAPCQQDPRQQRSESPWDPAHGVSVGGQPAVAGLTRRQLAREGDRRGQRRSAWHPCRLNQSRTMSMPPACHDMDQGERRATPPVAPAQVEQCTRPRARCRVSAAADIDFPAKPSART